MNALDLGMTTQEETPTKKLHLVTWNDFFPHRTDTAADLQALALPQKDDKSSAHAALERVLQADSNSIHDWPRQTRISRRSALAKRKQETLGQETAESPLLRLATVELEVGNKEKARQLLRQMLRANPRFEPAWLWMADAVDSDGERRFCLEQALVINRRNALARRRLEALTSDGASSDRVDLEKSIEVQTEPRASKSQLSRLRAALRKHAVPIAIIYLGVLFIVGAFALIVPQSRLALYSVLLAILIAHTILTWGHSAHTLCLS
jgi:tetratricopeptide (TPR) repeat protein